MGHQSRIHTGSSSYDDEGPRTAVWREGKRSVRRGCLSLFSVVAGPLDLIPRPCSPAPLFC